MQKLQIFKNKKFGEIRTTEINNIPYICLADVCKILEIKNARDCKTRLNQDGVVITDTIDNLGRKQQATFVNESNLYKVIFQSRKPEAETFTEWVTNEVLPSIRKNGGYIVGQEELTESELLAKAVLVAKNKLQERNKQLEEAHKKIEADSGKVLFAECVESSTSSILVGELAKILKQNGIDMGQNRLFKWLRFNRYLISRRGSDFNMPTQTSMNMGLFEIKETSVTHSDGHTTISKTPKVTGKGQVYFVNKFKNLLKTD